MAKDFDPYVPDTDPFWTDGDFAVYEISDGHYMACRVNGAVHYRGTLPSIAAWIEREQAKQSGNRQRES